MSPIWGGSVSIWPDKPFGRGPGHPLGGGAPWAAATACGRDPFGKAGHRLRPPSPTIRLSPSLGTTAKENGSNGEFVQDRVCDGAAPQTALYARTSPHAPVAAPTSGKGLCQIHELRSELRIHTTKYDVLVPRTPRSRGESTPPTARGGAHHRNMPAVVPSGRSDPAPPMRRADRFSKARALHQNAKAHPATDRQNTRRRVPSSEKHAESPPIPINNKQNLPELRT